MVFRLNPVQRARELPQAASFCGFCGGQAHRIGPNCLNRLAYPQTGHGLCRCGSVCPLTVTPIASVYGCHRLGRLPCLPCPAGQVLESAFAVGVKGAFGVSEALLCGPRTKRVAIDRAGQWDAGVTGAFDVVQESAEALFPLVGLLGSHVQPGRAWRRR